MNANISNLQQPASQTNSIAQDDPITRQQIYLEKFIAAYNQRTKTSKQIAQTYRSTLADSSRNKAEFYFPLKEIYYPIVGKKSYGSKIWDVDGNEYIDLIMGFGSNLFGHNPPFIKQALLEQLEQGIQIGPQAELAGEVAELISELTGMERVAFSNTGTEAVMTAIRLARSATKRNKIAIFSESYHGHFDGTLVEAKEIDGNLISVPKAPGIPPSIVQDALVLDYGKERSLSIIKTHQHELAAVLVEPVQTSRPNLQPQEFLHQLRQLTHESGIALIFDEMVTGFRIHPGGAQAYFGLQADIAAYGKIVGGGMPIGIVAGKTAYMDKIDGGMWNYEDDSFPQVETTFFAGTYRKHPLALAAAKAVLNYLKARGATLQTELNQRTSHFVEQLNACFEAAKIPVRMTNFGSFFSAVAVNNSTTSEDSGALGISLLSYHLLHRGILIRSGSGFISTAHTDEELDRVVQALKDTILELREGGFL